MSSSALAGLAIVFVMVIGVAIGIAPANMALGRRAVVRVTKRGRGFWGSGRRPRVAQNTEHRTLGESTDLATRCGRYRVRYGYSGPHRARRFLMWWAIYSTYKAINEIINE